MRVPIIPPYTPQTGITVSTRQPHNPRPPGGLPSMAQEERELAELTRLIEPDVARMWTNHSVDGIALELRHKYGPHVTARLIWSMWQRIRRRS